MTFPPAHPDKAALRRHLRQARAAVPEGVRRAAAGSVMRRALRHRLLSRERRIGFYVPAKGEIDCLPLLNRALWMGVACYLPVVPGARQRKLWFARMGDGPHWRANRYGIPEYRGLGELVRISRLDVVFLPLLGFDTAGYRMGMGGGYYDASLGFLGRRKHWRRPRLVGLGFEAQKLAQIPVDVWDRPLDAVITESRYYRF